MARIARREEVVRREAPEDFRFWMYDLRFRRGILPLMARVALVGEVMSRDT